MLFFDGCHEYRDVLSDFYNAYGHVKDGGLILLHDITDEGWPGPDQVWKELDSKSIAGADRSENSWWWKENGRSSTLGRPLL
jgi:hypothetical protein